MKAIVNTGPGRLEMLEVPAPRPGPGEVRVKTAACGVCATDLAMIAGWERTPFPAIPGHEWSGTVDAAGAGVDPAVVGRRCVAENVLSDGGEVGFEHPGGYGEYLVTSSANLQYLPDDYPLVRATLIEPLAVSVHGMDRLRPNAPSPVLILGDGPIGLLMLMLFTHGGRDDVTLVGGRDWRLDLAKRFGARRTVNYHVQGVHDLGQFGAIIEASGSEVAVQLALDVLTPGGRILVMGDYGLGRADFAWNHLLHREIELIGSNASAGAWPEAVRLAVEGRLPLDDLITHRVPAARFAEALSLVRDRPSGAIKVVLEWEP